MATSTLAWRIPWTEEPGLLQYTGPQSDKESDTTEQLTFTFTSQKAEDFILDSILTICKEKNCGEVYILSFLTINAQKL